MRQGRPRPPDNGRRNDFPSVHSRRRRRFTARMSVIMTLSLRVDRDTGRTTLSKRYFRWDLNDGGMRGVNLRFTYGAGPVIAVGPTRGRFARLGFKIDLTVIRFGACENRFIRSAGRHGFLLPRDSRRSAGRFSDLVVGRRRTVVKGSVNSWYHVIIAVIRDKPC